MSAALSASSRWLPLQALTRRRANIGDYCSRSNRTTKRGSPYLRKTLFNIMKVHLQRAPADEPVFQFLDKKRAEGKPYYVYMTAAQEQVSAPLLRQSDDLSTLEGLPPVDMDSTGLHHME